MDRGGMPRLGRVDGMMMKCRVWGGVVGVGRTAVVIGIGKRCCCRCCRCCRLT